MELDHNHDRDHRAASVLSGMSQEDMEAAETLKSLQARGFTCSALDSGNFLPYQIVALLPSSIL